MPDVSVKTKKREYAKVNSEEDQPDEELVSNNEKFTMCTYWTVVLVAIAVGFLIGIFGISVVHGDAEGSENPDISSDEIYTTFLPEKSDKVDYHLEESPVEIDMRKQSKIEDLSSQLDILTQEKSALIKQVEDMKSKINKLLVQKDASSNPEKVSADTTSDILDPSIKSVMFLFVGQSNMLGTQNVAEDVDMEENPHVKKLNNRGTKIEIARPRKSLGPDLPFCKYLQPMLGSDVDVIAVNTAMNGASIQKWMPGKHLFADTIEKVKKAMELSGVTTLSGILWHQGESNSNYKDVLKNHTTTRDCGARICGPYNYGEFLLEVINGFRKEFGANVPIVLGEVAPFIMENESYHMDFRGIAFVNSQIRSVADENDICVASTWDLHNVKPGAFHFSTESQRILGKRYAECWLKSVRK